MLQVGKCSSLSAEFFLMLYISSSVQNGSVHQKDGLNDDDFEPYLSPQARPVSKSTR